MRPTLPLVLLTTALAGCSLYFSEDDDDQPDPPTSRVETRQFPAGPGNRDLDLLFVIDNSGSMAEEQASLAANFPQFVNVLSSFEGGLPNLHIGVISTNVGTGGVNIGGCSTASRPNGDDGHLLTNNCAGLTGSFIADIAGPGGSRDKNYSGDLATTFACMAQLGNVGCGFEQPLEAMRRALQPGANPGFLREQAQLAVVFLGDEDDCSAMPGGTLFTDPSASISSPLGPRTSYRCFEFGVECDNDPNPRQFGTRSNCRPRASSTLVQSVSSYVDFLRSVKPFPSEISVAGIIGSVDGGRTASVGPDPDDSTRPSLSPSCSSSSGVAFPGFRLQSFFEGFPNRNTSTSICNEDLSSAFIGIASGVNTTLGIPCFENRLADRDPARPGLQPECSVVEFLPLGDTRVNTTVLPECDGSSRLCWRVVDDLQACPLSGLTIRVENRAGSVPRGTLVEAQCVIE